MISAFRLAWRHLAYYRFRTAILILCVSLTLALPLSLKALVDRFQAQLRSRAAQTPLLIGAPGSEFDLTISTLYFDGSPPRPITMQTVEYVNRSGLGTAIPVHLRFTARKFPVVGTSFEYFSFRRSRLRSGRPLIRAGDCVLGSDVADQLGLGPGDRLLTDPENVFDLAGSYPLNMRITGILAPSGSPDDRAVFIDMHTAWIIEGLGHGHQGLEKEADENLILKRDQRSATASAAVIPYTEITDENIGSFHFHGDTSEFPVSSVIVAAPDVASATKLMGRFVSASSEVQVVEPPAVVERLLAIVFRIKRFFDVGAWLVGVVTGLFLVLVTLLTLRLRQREMQTMFKLGCSRGTIAQLQLAELAVVLLASVLLAATLAGLVQQLGPELLRRVLS